MIRINLIGSKAKPKAAAPKGHIFLFVGLILVEAVFLFVWYQMLSSDLEAATKRTKDATAKIADLKKVKQSWEKWQVEKADLARQTAIFESLRSDQLGPPNLLQYLSYVLAPVDDSPVSSDELKAQELVGWNPKWDPRRVWLTSMSESSGVLTIHGRAIDHEDVAEFYRRLESSDYLQHVEPGLQVRKVSPQIGIKYVEFTVTAEINYSVPGTSALAAGGKSGKPSGLPGEVRGAVSAAPGGDAWTNSWTCPCRRGCWWWESCLP
ncbi:MAG: PilN domain-containing protein [Deltaproteobacteria bacterium]|nr:PilN domain-containing protein [Deltaproteobacteria bacterium]